MRINLAIFVPITVLSVSLSLITLTFILADWLMDVASLDTYGIWQACFVESNYCLPWLEMSNTFNITTPGITTRIVRLQRFKSHANKIGLFFSLSKLFRLFHRFPSASIVHARADIHQHSTDPSEHQILASYLRCFYSGRLRGRGLK